MNKFDFGYEYLGLSDIGKDGDELTGFLDHVNAWRKNKTEESSRQLGTLIGSIYKDARPAAGSPLSAMVFETDPHKAVLEHVIAFGDELLIGHIQAFKDGWWTGYRGE